MHRIITIIATGAVVVAGAVAVVGTAAGGASSGNPNRTLAQAMANGWDCTPLILLGGHYHCSPPGRPSVADNHCRHRRAEHRSPGISAGRELCRNGAPDPSRSLRGPAVSDRSVAPGSSRRPGPVLRLPPLRVHAVTIHAGGAAAPADAPPTGRRLRVGDQLVPTPARRSVPLKWRRCRSRHQADHTPATQAVPGGSRS